MKPQLIKVTTYNKMLFIKGLLVRTPLTTIVKSKNELDLLKHSMIHQEIEYTIEDYKPKVKTAKKIKAVESKKKIVKEKKEPTTILEKISTESE